MPASDEREFDRLLRPLVAATTGSGLMTIGVLQFTGSIWSSAGPQSQEIIATAARTTLLTFILTAAALGIGFSLKASARPLVRAALNLYGSLVFLVGAFLSGSYISSALFNLRPETRNIPESLEVFLGSAALALIALLVAICIGMLTELIGWLAATVSGKGPDPGEPPSNRGRKEDER